MEWVEINHNKEKKNNLAELSLLDLMDSWTQRDSDNFFLWKETDSSHGIQVHFLLHSKPMNFIYGTDE